jgi:hypothetical protein
MGIGTRVLEYPLGRVFSAHKWGAGRARGRVLRGRRRRVGGLSGCRNEKTTGD